VGNWGDEVQELPMPCLRNEHGENSSILSVISLSPPFLLVSPEWSFTSGTQWHPWLMGKVSLLLLST
jgi:hypothetical protein